MRVRISMICRSVFGKWERVWFEFKLEKSMHRITWTLYSHCWRLHCSWGARNTSGLPRSISQALVFEGTASMAPGRNWAGLVISLHALLSPRGPIGLVGNPSHPAGLRLSRESWLPEMLPVRNLIISCVLALGGFELLLFIYSV